MSCSKIKLLNKRLRCYKFENEERNVFEFSSKLIVKIRKRADHYRCVYLYICLCRLCVIYIIVNPVDSSTSWR